MAYQFLKDGQFAHIIPDIKTIIISYCGPRPQWARSRKKHVDTYIGFYLFKPEDNHDWTNEPIDSIVFDAKTMIYNVNNDIRLYVYNSRNWRKLDLIAGPLFGWGTDRDYETLYKIFKKYWKYQVKHYYTNVI
jgi:hypothetical protein